MSADAEEGGEEWVVSWGRECEGRCQREGNYDRWGPFFEAKQKTQKGKDSF